MAEIEVGDASEGVFIGFSDELYDFVKKPLSGKKLNVMRMTRSDAAWLVGALRKQLAGDKEADAGDYMDQPDTLSGKCPKCGEQRYYNHHKVCLACRNGMD